MCWAGEQLKVTLLAPQKVGFADRQTALAATGWKAAV